MSGWTSETEVAVKNIARALGDDISEEKPILDSRLPDGSRVAAVFSPCSLGGTTLTIRKFQTRFFTADELVRIGTMTPSRTPGYSATRTATSSITGARGRRSCSWRTRRSRLTGASVIRSRRRSNLLDVDLHFHDLRRECASRWWDETKDIWRVSQWLGHSSIKMTQRYLALTDTRGQGADMAARLGHRKMFGR